MLSSRRIAARLAGGLVDDRVGVGDVAQRRDVRQRGLWVTFAAGCSAVYQAMVVVLAGVIGYAFVRARRESTGQVPAPADLEAAATGGENPEGRS